MKKLRCKNFCRRREIRRFEGRGPTADGQQLALGAEIRGLKKQIPQAEQFDKINFHCIKIAD